jgi:hypothetical protein
MVKVFLTIGVILLFALQIQASEELLAKQKLIGKGRFSFLIWNVYDAKLYSPNGIYNTNQPFTLKLTYLRDILGVDIAKSTIDEIRKQGFKNELKLAKWNEQILRIFPDISTNESLTGTFTEKKTIIFYNDNKFIGEIKDKEFAKLFFDIWLGEKTSAPHLRKQLLGGV